MQNLLISNMSPGSKAAVALTKPFPMSKGVAGICVESGLLYVRWAKIGFPCMSVRVAVVDNAEPIAAGLKEGNFCFTREARPATWGAAILVPESIAKLSPKTVYQGTIRNLRDLSMKT
jgi:hypothetical protein